MSSVSNKSFHQWREVEDPSNWEDSHFYHSNEVVVEQNVDKGAQLLTIDGCLVSKLNGHFYYEGRAPYDAVVQEEDGFLGRGFCVLPKVEDSNGREAIVLSGNRKVYLLKDDGVKWVEDPATGERYLNESKACIRCKSVAYALVSLLLPVFLLFKTVAIICISAWNKDAALLKRNLCKLTVVAPALMFYPVTALLNLALAFYGIIRPYDGRARIAKLERFIYGGALIAPCFQPEAAGHLLGGKTQKRNAW